MSSWIAHLASAAERALDLVAVEVLFSSIVAAVVWIACLALRRRLPALQHALWILVLVRLVLPPGLSHPLAAGALLSRAGLEGAWLHSVPDAHISDSVAGSPTATRAARPTEAKPARAAVAFFWLGAVSLLWIRDSRRARALHRLLATASPVTDRLALRLVARWKRRLRISRPVRLVSADHALSPFTDGVLRPVLFIPAALLRPGQRLSLAAAISHELAHVARFDVLTLRVERFVGRLYFFHPVVWLTSRRLHALREGLSDALATSEGLLSPRLYVRGLLDLLQLDLQGVEAPSLSPSQRRILMRLESVLSNSRRQIPRSVRCLAAAAAIGLFVLPLAGASAPAPGKGASLETGAPREASMVHPLPSGRVTRRFGKSLSPIGKGEENHAGIDLAAPQGTPVLAASAGTVELAVTHYAPRPAAGTVVILDHENGRKTFYSHLSSLAVEAGQKVKRAEAIGAVGSTGLSTGPHLHFELWKDAVHVDPAGAIPALALR